MFRVKTIFTIFIILLFNVDDLQSQKLNSNKIFDRHKIVITEVDRDALVSTFYLGRDRKR